MKHTFSLFLLRHFRLGRALGCYFFPSGRFLCHQAFCLAPHLGNVFLVMLLFQFSVLLAQLFLVRYARNCDKSPSETPTMIINNTQSLEVSRKKKKKKQLFGGMKNMQSHEESKTTRPGKKNYLDYGKRNGHNNVLSLII
jgi:hypothetical protein